MMSSNCIDMDKTYNWGKYRPVQILNEHLIQKTLQKECTVSEHNLNNTKLNNIPFMLKKKPVCVANMLYVSTQNPRIIKV